MHLGSSEPMHAAAPPLPPTPPAATQPPQLACLQVAALASQASDSSPDLCRFAGLLLSLLGKGNTYAGGLALPP